MSFRIFQYTLPASPDLSDLNAFIAGHRVVSVSHHLAPVAGGSMLVFVVETVAGKVGGGPADNSGTPSARIDYREQLTPSQFEVFSRLRVQPSRPRPQGCDEARESPLRADICLRVEKSSGGASSGWGDQGWPDRRLRRASALDRRQRVARKWRRSPS